MVEDAVVAVRALAQRAARVCVLTGAGMSAESGIATFRDAMSGLWSRFDPAELASEEQRAELAALHERLEKSVRNRDAFFDINEQFHMALLQMAGNRWALQLVTDLRKVMKLNRHHSLFKKGRLADSLAEHRALMAALAAHDAATATRLMKAHFDNGLEAAAGPTA